MSEFSPYQAQENSELSKDLYQKIKSNLENNNYQVEQANSKDLSQNLKQAKDKNAFLLVDGYYSKNDIGNLLFYSQIYNPQTGYVTDALAATDNLELLKETDVKIDKEDLRVDDEKRKDDFIKKLVLRIRTNPSRKEKPENIGEELLYTNLGKEKSFPIRRAAIEDEAQNIFKFIEDQVVVTATRKQTKLKDAPAAVYVITEKQIQERGYRTISDALRDVPGFDFQHTYGVYPDLIHQRGLIGTMQRTLLYVDGVPDNNIFENAMLGGTVRFPLHNVERIEIVSGPASALYGANAFNGIINIITRDGQTNPGNHADVTYGGWESNFRNPGYGMSLSTRGNSEGKNPIQYSVGLYYYQTQGPNFAGINKLDRPNYGATDADPYYNYNYDPYYKLEKKLCGGVVCDWAADSVGYYSSPSYNNSREDTYNITAKFSRGGFRFQTINWQYLQAEGHFGNGTQWVDTKQRGLETSKFDARNNFRRLGILNGSLINGEAGFTGSNWDVRNNTVMTGYLANVSDTLTLDSELVVRHTEILNSSRDAYQNTLGPAAYYQPGDVVIEDTYDRPDYAYQIEERLQWEPHKQFSTTAGVVAKHFVAAKDYGSADRYRYNNYAIYIQQLYKPVEKLRLTAGYRHDYITSYGNANTPRLSAVYSLTQNLTLKMLLGTAFREPSGEELYSLTPQRKPNESLKPELLRSGEIGIGYRFLKKYYVSIQSYYNSIRNLILEVQTSDFSTINGKDPKAGNPWNQYQNVGKARVLGTEVDSSLQLSEILSLNLRYTYSEGYYYDLPSSLQLSPSTEGRKGDNVSNDIYLETYKYFTGKSTVVSEGRIPNIPTHKGYLGITYYFLKSLSFYAGMNYIDVRRTVATNPEKAVTGYKMVKINIRKNDFFFKGMYLDVLINNATNRLFFDPGIRVADGNFYPSMMPIEKRNVWITLGYKF
ncbi:MAG: TonB-dependent receptor [Leptospiraceae bacterium]|nr:TonB-dependent receptor [Leptospiraceae bacterium]